MCCAQPLWVGFTMLVQDYLIRSVCSGRSRGVTIVSSVVSKKTCSFSAVRGR